MPPPKNSPPAESRYPAVERFIERSTHHDVTELFAPLRQSLEALKGPRAAQAQKVATALDRSQELLQLLLNERQKMFVASRPTGR